MSAGKENFDVLIIGAGPAGLSAAIWCADLGLRAAVFEKGPEAGGQLLSIYNPITNYPGLITENGRALRDRFMETFENTKVPLMLSTEIAAIDVEKTSIITADGGQYFARAVIFATGVRRRRLNVPGEDKFRGKGIIESGSRDKLFVRDKIVAIIGGGDAALENALILAEHASRVHVIHRRNKFRAREDFVKQAAQNPKIDFIFDTGITAIDGTESVNSISLLNQKTQQASLLPVDELLIRIGVEPNTDLLQGKIELDADGYAVVDPTGQTSAPGVYAVGDSANPISPTIATAIGTAASAVKAMRHLCETENNV